MGHGEYAPEISRETGIEINVHIERKGCLEQFFRALLTDNITGEGGAGIRDPGPQILSGYGERIRLPLVFVIPGRGDIEKPDIRHLRQKGRILHGPMEIPSESLIDICIVLQNHGIIFLSIEETLPDSSMTEIAADPARRIELFVISPDMFLNIALCPQRNTIVLHNVNRRSIDCLEPLELVVFHQLLQLRLSGKTFPAILAVLQINTIYEYTALHGYLL
jgi:hypothetical protein